MNSKEKNKILSQAANIAGTCSVGLSINFLVLQLVLTIYFLFYLKNVNVEMGKWETVETCGSPPSPRTCHSMVSVGSKFYVFGGGLSGPDPVPDTTLYVFNAGEIYNACKHLILHGISPHFTIV